MARLSAFSVTERTPTIDTTRLATISDLAKETGKPYQTVRSAMHHRNAPSPVLDHHGYCLWRTDTAVSYLKDRAKRGPGVRS